MMRSQPRQHHSIFSTLLVLVPLLLALLLPYSASAVIEAVQFEDPATEQRYRDLIAELRCLVCQNQNLADSDADLAKDLREKTAEMLRDGRSDAEILSYMQERYGDFVLYRPPLSGSTLALWIAPLVMLLAALIGVLLTIKRRQAAELLRPAHQQNDKQRVQVRNLLKTAPDLNSQSTAGLQKSDPKGDSE
ncbi:MAG: cytochrome c-type biogenesis protein CcmH [Gammaproteobacteria bacterium]|nr:cytochrome c-type biogenesis protein CcmH [Gammaproteobacteria bacterium]